MIFKEGIDIKRLAIFFFYDDQGIVDDYIPYMLKDLKENLSEILVVSLSLIHISEPTRPY